VAEGNEEDEMEREAVTKALERLDSKDWAATNAPKRKKAVRHSMSEQTQKSMDWEEERRSRRLSARETLFFGPSTTSSLGSYSHATASMRPVDDSITVQEFGASNPSKTSSPAKSSIGDRSFTPLSTGKNQSQVGKPMGPAMRRFENERLRNMRYVPGAAKNVNKVHPAFFDPNTPSSVVTDRA